MFLRLVSKLVIKERIRTTKVSPAYKSSTFEDVKKNSLALPRWKILNATKFKFAEFNFDGLLCKPVLFKSGNGANLSIFLVN